ncbi:MAG: hypothetical protein SGBAC_008942 [Bacillariaceae sp.]
MDGSSSTPTHVNIINPSSKSIISLEQEIQKSKDYVNSIKDTKRNLVFVHIPKTAGSTIEDVGAKTKLSWGSCRFNHRPKRALCKKPKMLYPNEFEWPMKVGYWHIPPYYFPLMGSNPYRNVDLFAIIRDPLERLLSEFYYVCRKKLKPEYWDIIDCNRTRVHEPEYLNYWLRREINNSKSSLDMTRTAKDVLFRNGHYTPQYDFLVSPDQVRMVDYVMHMKNLKDEFQPLMDAYGINAAMPPRKANVAHEERDLSAEHLDHDTNAMVNDRYGKDFELLKAQRKEKP